MSKPAEESVEIEPQCFSGRMAFAVTNRGHLIPCCRCDDPRTMNDPDFQRLLAVSRISENNSIADILRTPEWQKFCDDLKDSRGPHACQTTCKKNKGPAKTQTLKIIDPETKTVLEQIDR